MATLKIKVSDKILDKVLWLLSQFNQEDLQIVDGDNSFEADKQYVQNELSRLESGESRAYTVEEVDDILEKSIRQYEN